MSQNWLHDMTFNCFSLTNLGYPVYHIVSNRFPLFRANTIRPNLYRVGSEWFSISWTNDILPTVNRTNFNGFPLFRANTIWPNLYRVGSEWFSILWTIDVLPTVDRTNSNRFPLLRAITIRPTSYLTLIRPDLVPVVDRAKVPLLLPEHKKNIVKNVILLIPINKRQEKEKV